MSSIDKKNRSIFKDKSKNNLLIKSVAYKVGEKRRKVFFHLNKNKNIRKCKPFEVGSYKHELKIFTM